MTLTRLKMLNRRENKYKSKKSSSNDPLSAFYKIVLIKVEDGMFSFFFFMDSVYRMFYGRCMEYIFHF